MLVVPPGRERLELAVARLPLRSFGPHARAQVLRRSDLAIAQTHHESGLLRRLGARRVTVIPNGVAPAPTAPAPDGTPATPYVLLLGTVNARSEHGPERALPGVDVVAGGFARRRSARFERARRDRAREQPRGRPASDVGPQRRPAAAEAGQAAGVCRSTIASTSTPAGSVP